MKLDRKQIIRIVGIAVVIIVFSSGISILFAPKPVPSESVVIAKPEKKVTIKVLVSTIELARGAILNHENSYWLEIDEEAYKPFQTKYISQNDEISSQIYNGKFIIVDTVSNGEPITKTKLQELGKGGALSSFITKGKRAVSLELEPHNAGGGFVLPNDLVDVIYAKQSDIDGKALSSFIIRGAKVIGVNQQLSTGSVQNVPANIITLEVTPKEAQILLAAKVDGEITLLLRAIDDDKVMVSEEIKKKEVKVKTITVTKSAKVIRFGG